MAKGNLFLGHARGKVGSIVFARVDGTQITRSRSEVVKNPRTDAQMIQRIIMNTVVQAYSKMQPIVDHSFQGLKAGQQCMSEFTKRNAKLLRSTLAQFDELDTNGVLFTPLGTNGVATNTYVISHGTLPEINISAVTTLGCYLSATENTYEGILAATGLQRGDQLTFVMLCGKNINQQVFDYARIILDPKNSDGTSAGLDTPFIVGNAVNLPHPNNENTGLTFAFDHLGLNIMPRIVCNMAGAIASRKMSDDSWKRSNAAMIAAENSLLGVSMQDALDAFASGGITVENPLYLNNAVRAARTRAAIISSLAFTSLNHAGTNVLSSTAEAVSISELGSVSYALSGLGEGETAYLVVSDPNKAVGSALTPVTEGLKDAVAITTASGSVSIADIQLNAGSYQFYLVADNKVKQACGKFTYGSNGGGLPEQNDDAAIGG